MSRGRAATLPPDNWTPSKPVLITLCVRLSRSAFSGSATPSSGMLRAASWLASSSSLLWPLSRTSYSVSLGFPVRAKHRGCCAVINSVYLPRFGSFYPGQPHVPGHHPGAVSGQLGSSSDTEPLGLGTGPCVFTLELPYRDAGCRLGTQGYYVPEVLCLGWSEHRSVDHCSLPRCHQVTGG